MKIRRVIAGNVALLLLAAVSVQGADKLTVYHARFGSQMRIQGTANALHKVWLIQSPVIGGTLEVGPNFPTEPGQAVTPGKVEAKANAFIPARSLKSINEDGSHYDDRMDEVTGVHLKVTQYPRISYRLTELTLKEVPKTKDAPYVFDSKGDLTICGVTKPIEMTVNVLPQPNKELRITGNTSVKMSDYKVKPVDINLMVYHIKTGDEVKLTFTWVLAQPKTAAAEASK
jgi:polyisoprenoid-binding protein YceI